MSAPRFRTLACVGLGLAVVLTLWLSGIRALSVETGSMGSSMPVGSLAITRPVPSQALSVGDVVSIARPDGERVTHRVLSVDQPDAGSTSVSLVLKGDANTVADADPVLVEGADRLVVAIPHAGVAVEAVTSGPALIVVGVTTIILLLRRRWRVSGLAVVMGTTVMLVTTGPTAAVFTDTATVASDALTSGRINPPTLPTATQAATTGIVNIGFTATTVGTQSAAPSGYEVYRYTAASGGTGALVCTTTTIFTCTEERTAIATGTYHYAVRAKFAANWVAESARRSYSHDATAPTVTTTRPFAGDSNGSKNLRDTVTAGCGTGAVACGTTADTGGGTVSTVQYTLLRKRTTSGVLANACWNGSSWVASSTGVCSFAAPTGTTSWRVPGDVAVAYPNPGGGVTDAFVLVIRATDSFGNQSNTQRDYWL